MGLNKPDTRSQPGTGQVEVVVMFGAVKREKSSSFEAPGSLVLAVVGLVAVIVAVTILVALKIA